MVTVHYGLWAKCTQLWLLKGELSDLISYCMIIPYWSFVKMNFQNNLKTANMMVFVCLFCSLCLATWTYSYSVYCIWPYWRRYNYMRAGHLIHMNNMWISHWRTHIDASSICNQQINVREPLISGHLSLTAETPRYLCRRIGLGLYRIL